jgi:multiple sugar transport system permease protein
MRYNKYWGVLIIFVVLIFLLFEIFPIYWIISNSFKSYKDITFFPPKFIFKPTFKNYIYAIQKNNFLSAILDSAIIAFTSVAISVFVGSLAAYGIVRLKIGGRWLLMYSVSSRMIPPILLLLPLFIIFSKLRLIDSYFVLIITYSTLLLSFTIWQMSSFLKEIPRDIEEAAIIDGCSIWQVFFRIVLPMSRPGLTAVAIFSFLWAWNDFIFASILVGHDVITAPVANTYFIIDFVIPWGPMTAASTLIMIPAFIFILIVQKQMVRGLTMGALKG